MNKFDEAVKEILSEAVKPKVGDNVWKDATEMTGPKTDKITYGIVKKVKGKTASILWDDEKSTWDVDTEYMVFTKEGDWEVQMQRLRMDLF